MSLSLCPGEGAVASGVTLEPVVSDGNWGGLSLNGKVHPLAQSLGACRRQNQEACEWTGQLQVNVRKALVTRRAGQLWIVP